MNDSKQRQFRSAAALVVCLALPVLAAAQTITLTVPFRGAVAKQTASTTVEFDASAITAGATVTVAGKSLAVPALACAGLACLVADTTDAGDDLQLKRITSTNRVQVQLTYLASFGAGPNYCAYVGPAGAKTIDFTLTGFTFANATNGYRITSFMAPSDVSCDIPYVRVPSQRPSFPPAGPLTKLGRLPLNVVLVLDRSGSMGATVPGSADIRWNRLKSSVEQFVKVWQVAGAPPAGMGTVSSDGNADDRLGVIFFDSATVDASLDGSFFKARGAIDSPWWTPVNSALGAVGPGGSTSIGGGIARGRTQLDTVDSVTGDTAIVLFTDGEQNTMPCVMKEGESVASWCNPVTAAPAGSRLIISNALGTLLAKSAPRGPIFTIGLGEGSGPFADLLEQISQETAGRARITPTGALMDSAFVDALVDSLKGSTMSTLMRTSGTLAAGATFGDPVDVFVDDAIPRVVFVARWEGRGTPGLEIRRPDGMVVTGNLRQTGDGLIVAGIDVPTHGPSGKWQVRLQRPAGVAAQGTAFQLSAHAVESRLSYRITESPRTGTGSPITVTAEVGWDGQGLASLPAGAIKVILERPGENLGNILFGSDVRGDPRSPGGDIEDAVRAKLSALNAGGQLATRIAPLPDPGVHSMAEVGAGRYETTFDAPQVGGQYRFRVVLDWTDARTGLVKRIETTERQMPVMPSAEATQVAAQHDATGVTLTVTPKDAYGNYVGPGYGKLFNVQVAGGMPVPPVTDPSVRGVYVVRIDGVAPGSDPNVKIGYRGVTLRDSPLSQVETAGGSNIVGGKLAAWGGVGIAVPHGSFSNTHERGAAAALGVEYALNNMLSIEAMLGGNRLDGKGANVDVDVTQLGINGKVYFTAAPLRVFATAGMGAYAFDPGSTRFGGSVGAGLQYQFTPNWGIEGRYTLHGVANNSPQMTFSTLLLALRYAF